MSGKACYVASHSDKHSCCPLQTIASLGSAADEDYQPCCLLLSDRLALPDSPEEIVIDIGLGHCPGGRQPCLPVPCSLCHWRGIRDFQLRMR